MSTRIPTRAPAHVAMLPLADDAEIAKTILALAYERGAGKSLCPSEVARALSADWLPLMPDVRRIAAEMPEIVATQRGTPVDPVKARGPIRLSLAPDDIAG